MVIENEHNFFHYGLERLYTGNRKDNNKYSICPKLSTRALQLIFTTLVTLLDNLPEF
jgi:hypothetical protein